MEFGDQNVAVKFCFSVCLSGDSDGDADVTVVCKRLPKDFIFFALVAVQWHFGPVSAPAADEMSTAACVS